MEAVASHLKAGADVFSTDLSGHDALTLALANGHEDLGLVLLGRMVQDKPSLEWMAKETKGSGYTLLHSAVAYRRHRVLQAVLAILGEEAPAFILLRSRKTGENAVHLAARENAVRALSVLLHRCPQALESVSEKQMSPLTIALSLEREEAVRELLSQGADPRRCLPEGDPHGIPAWCSLSSTTSLETLGEKMDWSVERTPAGHTLLNVLLSKGRSLRLNVFKAAYRQAPVLLNTAGTVEGWMPLHSALLARVSVSVLDFLVDKGGLWGAPDHWGRSALDLLNAQVESGESNVDYLLPTQVAKYRSIALAQRLDGQFPSTDSEGAMPPARRL